ncbi:MAG: endonuclease [Alphaproteobacteria bacterium]|jgi:endonuclease/exonuclease/phosphatase family metal-dependent hydrolase|nr:endonuclease [Alphaproteobacteria bacterium]MBT5389318.1 endonuclease [Alphaproteobacteria bacterium]MBT5540945.1 endonuclease [Alphaproteobacteria bacterium]MBT5654936.1 endonuclease [Alphaproteobacteria bacterium]
MIRLATFNIENLSLGGKNEPPLSNRLDILRPQLQRLQADILCLQEINASSKKEGRGLEALDLLLHDTDYQNYHRTESRSTKGPTDKHNLVILSRFPFEQKEQYHNDLVSPPQFSPTNTVGNGEGSSEIIWDRPFIYGRIPIENGKTLHIINLHLRAPRASHIAGQKVKASTWKTVPAWAEGYFISSIKRAGQALEARLLIDKILDEDTHALIAVCGDFNADEYEVPTRLLRADDSDTGNGELAYRSLVGLEHSIPSVQRYSVIHQGRRQMLDHILVTRPLLGHFDHVEIHNESLGDEIFGERNVYDSPDSYHAPLLGNFNL